MNQPSLFHFPRITTTEPPASLTRTVILKLISGWTSKPDIIIFTVAVYHRMPTTVFTKRHPTTLTLRGCRHGHPVEFDSRRRPRQELSAKCFFL